MTQGSINDEHQDLEHQDTIEEEWQDKGAANVSGEPVSESSTSNTQHNDLSEKV